MTVAAPDEPALLRVVTACAQDRWDDYVSAHPEATGYHLWGWRQVMSRAFGRETRYLAVEDEDRLVGVLPLVLFRSRVFGRFVVSMPFLNYGGVLADSEAAARLLLEAGIEVTRRAGASHLELRHTARRLFEELPSKTHKVGMRLLLAATPEKQWDAIDRKLRNQVRKADKSDLTILRGGPELLDAFYEVFAWNMRDLGTPVYGKRFFAEVLAAFPAQTRVLCVKLRERPIAGSIVFRYRRMMEVPWASSLREFNPLCANVRLYWEMLQLAIEEGCTAFDFGRSTPNEGTYRFKEQWGATPVPLVWEYWMAEGRPLPDLSPKNPKYDAAISAWQKLPLGVTRWLGPHIVRNIP
jgi:FemAB-related protein (PEP-CTERM system-associated)